MNFDFLKNFLGTESHLENTVYNTVPLVIHANGPSKLFLNTLGNYIPKSWNAEEGCLNCWEDMNSLEKKKVKSFDMILILLFYLFGLSSRKISLKWWLEFSSKTQLRFSKNFYTNC